MDGQRRRPVGAQDVQTDAAARVDVGVVDLGREHDLGRLEGVVHRHTDLQTEHAALVRRRRRALYNNAEYSRRGGKRQAISTRYVVWITIGSMTTG